MKHYIFGGSATVVMEAVRHFNINPHSVCVVQNAAQIRGLPAGTVIYQCAGWSESPLWPSIYQVIRLRGYKTAMLRDLAVKLHLKGKN